MAVGPCKHCGHTIEEHRWQMDFSPFPNLRVTGCDGAGCRCRDFKEAKGK